MTTRPYHPRTGLTCSRTRQSLVFPYAGQSLATSATCGKVSTLVAGSIGSVCGSAAAAAITFIGTVVFATEPLPEVAFREESGKLAITVDSQPAATYVYVDDKIPRPYFADVHGPGGVQLTRNFPPIEGQDRTDHATMHPGIWMAFGDLNGTDIWRNKGRVVHEQFMRPHSDGPGRGTFTVRNRYETTGGEPICREECERTLLVRPYGYLLLWDSVFSADREFYFGDQEEMGLGIRVTTPVSVQEGGIMLDSQGRRNEREIWGNAADWCDYSGTVDGRHVGMTVLCHPDNFRPCWMHARNYGFVAANPFGRHAFRKGEPSKVVVKPGEALRLRYGILLHAGPNDSGPDFRTVYTDFVRLTRFTVK